MQRAIQATALGLALAAVVAAAPADTTNPAPEGRTFGVSMTDFTFQPAALSVQPGDVIRFVQKGIQPHNVEFRKVPRGTDLGDTRMGRFLVKRGDVYELRIDGRFRPGTYEFVCTPHEMMGMKGSFTVVTGT